MGHPLTQRLDYRRFPKMDLRLAAIIAFVLGQTWTEPALRDLRIAPDGSLRTGERTLGTVAELERKIEALFRRARLTPLERQQRYPAICCRVRARNQDGGTSI